MKKQVSKKDVRQQLEQEMQEFLNKGGNVDQVPRGISGRESAEGPLKLPFGETSLYKNRTFVNDVVSAIDERKKNKNKTPSEKPKRPVKKMVYDDFGDPLRWEWVTE